MAADKPQGHPRHQVREFTVYVKQGNDRAFPLRVSAQTEHDAILRAGVKLATERPMLAGAFWSVRSVKDPAPFAWSPSDDQPSR